MRHTYSSYDTWDDFWDFFFSKMETRSTEIFQDLDRNGEAEFTIVRLDKRATQDVVEEMVNSLLNLDAPSLRWTTEFWEGNPEGNYPTTKVRIEY